MMKFPKTLPWGHLTQKGFYNLIESESRDYAFYEHKLNFGFKHGITIIRMEHKETKKSIFRVRQLSGNTWGKGTYIIVREEYFKTLEDAIGNLKGETRIYKPKRKPELIRPMTEEEIKQFAENGE